MLIWTLLRPGYTCEGHFHHLCIGMVGGGDAKEEDTAGKHRVPAIKPTSNPIPQP